ncbi:hypothetical protein HG430_001500 [Candidatus Gracilibacteria bacterium]|nr:hypothetical protein [Candidatus Gracilibacteria bacterium]MBF0913855.1 hypothetical protein [Candidatus Gracilibacteria bacterium]
MKKIFIITTLIFALTSCLNSTNTQDLDKAKSDLLHGTSSTNTGTTASTGSTTDSSSTGTTSTGTSSTGTLSETDKKEETKNPIETKYLTDEKFIELDSLNISDFASMEKEITGKTTENVDKIIVSFSNPTSKFPSDTFQLKKFKAGDKTFLYRAFQKYETLDYGENTYTFEAYSGTKVSKLELKVNIEKKDEKKDGDKKEDDKKTTEPIQTGKLPTSSVFGNPVEIGNGKVTYSDIKGLEIENIGEKGPTNSSDSVTEFMNSKYKSIFYWNTKRPVVGDKGVSYFVVRVEGNKYLYEKHYYVGGYYGVLSLEQGDFNATGTVEEKAKALSELNTTLREKNATFSKVKIANILFESLGK